MTQPDLSSLALPDSPRKPLLNQRYCTECEKGTKWDWDNCPYNCRCTYDDAYRAKVGLVSIAESVQSEINSLRRLSGSSRGEE